MIANVACEQEITGQVRHVAIEFIGRDGLPIMRYCFIAVVDEHIDPSGCFDDVCNALVDRVAVCMIELGAEMLQLAGVRQGGG